MAHNPGKYFPPAYFASSFWGTGGGELPPGFIRGSSAGVATASGTLTALFVSGSIRGTAAGSSAATGRLTFTGTPVPQETLLPLGNLGWGETYWPASQKRTKPADRVRKVSLSGVARGASSAKGRLTARNIVKEKQIVRDLIKKYENAVAAEIESDDEEALLMMW